MNVWHKGGIYQSLENWLEPLQWLVNILLIGVVTISVYALLALDPVQKTALAVWLVSP